jgi:hypothetical protein
MAYTFLVHEKQGRCDFFRNKQNLLLSHLPVILLYQIENSAPGA